MSLAFNAGGLVIMGMGDSHKLCTIGMGERFEFGGYPRISKKEKEYMLRMFTSILKESSGGVGINGTIEINKDMEVLISSIISKEVRRDINVRFPVDSSKLIFLLDEI